jgi:hypothetical protein
LQILSTNTNFFVPTNLFHLRINLSCLFKLKTLVSKKGGQKFHFT